MRRLWLVLLICLWAAEGRAAVAKNDSGTAGVDFVGASTIDLTTFTVSAGSDQCLIAFVGTTIASTAITSVTWDKDGTPQAMTLIGSIENGSGSTGSVAFYRLIAPTTGNLKLQVILGSVSSGSIGAINFSGADQTTCIDAAHTVQQTDATVDPLVVTVTSTTTGATITGVSSLSSNFLSATGTVIVYNGTNGQTSADYIIGGTSNAHSWDLGASSHAWGVGIHIIAAAGAGVTSKSTLSLLGVGR